MAEVCFSCGYRDSVDGDPCGPCMEKRAVAEYIQKDEPQIQKRQDRWAGWTQSADALRERQRRHRLLKGTKPQTLAHPSSDPLELAHEALEGLRMVKSAVGAQPRALKRLEEVAELIRQLAWGPES